MSLLQEAEIPAETSTGFLVALTWLIIPQRALRIRAGFQRKETGLSGGIGATLDCVISGTSFRDC
jgi:hypothetical protein